MNFTEDMNHTSFQIDENPMFDKVISGITWGILQFPCNALMIGLIQFDRLGGDPLKRRVTDQVSKISERICTLKIYCTYWFFPAFYKHAL